MAAFYKYVFAVLVFISTLHRWRWVAQLVHYEPYETAYAPFNGNMHRAWGTEPRLTNYVDNWCNCWLWLRFKVLLSQLTLTKPLVETDLWCYFALSTLFEFAGSQVMQPWNSLCWASINHSMVIYVNLALCAPHKTGLS